jgi:hypothetical protein
MPRLKRTVEPSELEHAAPAPVAAPVAATATTSRGYVPADNSEVASLQRYLEAELSHGHRPRRLPLAVSLPLIAATSAGLWALLAAGVGQILR